MNLIVHFCYEALGHSGAAKQAVTLIKAQDRDRNNNYDHLIVSFEVKAKSVSKSKLADVNVISVPRSFFQIAKIVFELSKQSSAFHLHGFNFAVILLSVILRVKCILKTTLLGEDDFDSIRKSKYGMVKLFFVKKIHKNIALSRKIFNVNSCYVNSEKILVIPNGVELGRQENVKSNDFCAVGLICPRKRTYDAIAFYIKNYLKIDESKLYVVGPGPEMSHLPEFDIGYYRKCLELAATVEQGRVVFAGNLNKSSLNKIYANCIASILLSKNEGMPNVILEAMSFNCVPIVSEMDGVAYEIIDNKINGFILKNLNENIEFSDIEKISIKNLPREKVDASFDVNKIALIYNDIYKSKK